MADEQLTFLKEFPRGIYRTYFFANLEDGRLPESEEVEFKRHLTYLLSKERESIIQTPDEFFQLWLNGRSDRNPAFPHKTECGGFELQEPRVRIEKLGEGRTFGKIEGLVIASDFGYTGDFSDHFVFAVNDIFLQKVLTYHDKHGKETKANPRGVKQLTQNPIYRFATKPEKYPFESLNSAKSAPYTWTLVGVTPAEVYDSLKKIGFVWPADFK